MRVPGRPFSYYLKDLFLPLILPGFGILGVLPMYLIFFSDFIGKKHIDNHSSLLHFLGRYYLRPVGLYQVSRTENEKNQVIIRILRENWQRFSPPDIVLLDNFSSISGPVKAKGFVSQTIQEILSWKVIPIFIPQRSPWAQGGIEGSNGIFGKKFWKRHRFVSLQ